MAVGAIGKIKLVLVRGWWYVLLCYGGLTMRMLFF